jgi:uncharacterized protein
VSDKLKQNENSNSPPPGFDWEQWKAEYNVAVHGVSFQEAASVFRSQFAVRLPDVEHSDQEERFWLIGDSYSARILTVVHCEIEQDKIIKIISAWKAEREERDAYFENIRRWFGNDS